MNQPQRTDPPQRRRGRRETLSLRIYPC